jgi:hypothetical protein
MITSHYGCQNGSLFINHQANTFGASLHILLLNDDTFGSLTLTVHDASNQGVMTICSMIKNKNETISFRLTRSQEQAQSLNASVAPTTLLLFSEAVKTHIKQLIESRHLVTVDDMTKRAKNVIEHCYRFISTPLTTPTHDIINHLFIHITKLLDQETFDLTSLDILDELSSETPRTCLK